MVTLRIVTLTSFLNWWSTLCTRCLYKSELVFDLLCVLCSVILLRRGFEVCPMYWLPFVHLVHSSK